MLPTFPNFKKLELTDKKDVDKITSKYQPFSDFNFVSMWSWDVENEMRVCEYNGNLVVKFSDYISGEPFLSFLGTNEITKTTDDLLTLSYAMDMGEQLKLVPEIVANQLDPKLYELQESRDHFDYILDLNKLSDFRANKLNDHANFSRRFMDANYQDVKIHTLDLNEPIYREAISSLTTIWMKNKIQQNKTFLDHLEDAVKRFLYLTEDVYHEDFVSVGIFLKDKLVAFTINELVDKDYSICHFMKGDNSHKGIYSHLVTETCQEILRRGRKYINFEQDLGLKNLRQAKLTYEPNHFLKKYNVKKIV